MTIYHPPMTGLEAHMEEEMALQAHKTEKLLQQVRQAGKGRKSARSRETKVERETEEAMHLGR
jgi:hypothetical protein